MGTLPVYTPQQWKSTDSGYYSIDVDNTLFAYEGASRSYSLSAPGSDTVRFELHAGDAAAWDVSVGHATERDEIASRSTLANNGTALEISYGFTLEPGAPNTAQWMVLGQLHQDLADTTATGGPVFGVYLQGENMSVVARYNDANGKLVQMTLWTDPLSIVRGQEYQMDIKVVTDPTGQNGRLVVSRDGITVADYSGAIGDKNMTGVYWAEGIYRDAGATESVAADYSNLSIKTGSSVIFPDKSSFVAAPVLTVGAIEPVSGAIKAAAATQAQAASTTSAGEYQITLSGTTVPGGAIAILENGQIIANGTADKNGQTTIDIDVSGTGTHAYYSVATDPSGHVSPTANAVDVVIGTAATIGSSLDALAADSNLGAIYVTDRHNLKVGTSTDLSRILHDTGMLGKIQGAQYLQASNAVTGKTYDTEVLTTTLTGTLVERQRYSAGVLTLDQVITADRSSVTKSLNTLGGYDVLSSAADNFTTGFSRYDAKGNLSYSQSFGRDGSSTTVNYDLTTGKETSLVQKNADKSSTSVTFNISGQSYSVQMLVYGTSGTLIDQERYTATGTKTFSAIWNADGSRSVSNYDPKTAQETSNTLYSADGTSVQQVFGITGKAYTEQTTSFDKFNKVTSVTTSNAVGDVPPASTFILGLLGNTTATRTTVATDGSKQVQTFQYGSSTVLARVDSYNASGALTEQDVYGASGQKASTDVFATGGGDLMATFDAKGIVTGTVQTNTGGSKAATTYQPGSSTLLASIFNYTAAGVVSESESYDSSGRLTEVDGYDASGRKTTSVLRFSDGSRTSTSYNGATGAVLQASTVYSDGSRTDTNNAITGKPYASQTISYNAAGTVVALNRYYGGSAHTLAQTQVTNADGSNATSSYDTMGRETSRTLVTADGSSEVVNSTYAGSSMTASTTQAYHYASGNKLLWSNTTNANGTHTQVAAAAGISLSSTLGAADTFTASASGSDSFVFAPAFGQDMITNFHAGAGSAHDTVDLTALHLTQGPGQSPLNVLGQALHQAGQNVVLTITPTDTVTLKNTMISSLTSANFKV